MTLQKPRLILTVSLSTLLLASCSFIPEFQKPTQPVPERWAQEISAQGVTIPADWWTVYNDNYLNQMVVMAQRQNYSLQAGVERVNQARAALKAAGASLLPSADASLSLGKTRTNPAVGATTTTTPISGGLSIGYDLDLFGKNKAGVEAGKANVAASEYSQKALELAVTADVTEAYFNLLLTRERLMLGKENLKNAQELLRVVEARVKAGVDSQLELSQQKTAVANSEAALTSLQQTEVVYQNALSILLGQSPSSFVPTVGVLSQLVTPAIAAGQPSTLLERRPDIAAMEQQLVAANANIGAARAAFYPSVTLGGNLSATGTGFSDPMTTMLGIATGLTAPIFAGGRLEAGVEQATATQRELIANYQQTVLSAFGEVENALSAVKTTNDRQNALNTAMVEAQKAYEISRKRYDVGTIDFATMLNTQAALLGAQDNYAQAMKARLSASLDLVKALGGGWTGAR